MYQLTDSAYMAPRAHSGQRAHSGHLFWGFGFLIFHFWNFILSASPFGPPLSRARSGHSEPIRATSRAHPGQASPSGPRVSWFCTREPIRAAASPSGPFFQRVHPGQSEPIRATRTSSSGPREPIRAKASPSGPLREPIRANKILGRKINGPDGFSSEELGS